VLEGESQSLQANVEDDDLDLDKLTPHELIKHVSHLNLQDHLQRPNKPIKANPNSMKDLNILKNKKRETENIYSPSNYWTVPS